MKRTAVFNVLVITLLATLSILTGCSVIGGIIGGISDKNAKKMTTIPGWEVTTIQPGTTVEILGKNGHRATGVFNGIRTIPVEDYTIRFAENVAQYQELAGIPAPGDSIAVNYVSGTRAEGRLIGYYSEAVAVRLGSDSPARRIPFLHVASIKKVPGELFEPGLITNLMMEDKIPVMSAVAYTSNSGSRMIAVNEVDQITYRTKTYRALTGFFIGAAIDTAIILASKAKQRRDEREAERARAACRADPNCYSGGGISSCPLVYSFDGDEYVLDSETYGGAIFKAAQRTDLDNLDYLKAVDGTYRLSLRNENDETEYVDRLSLLAVDHSLETRIVPSFTGELHLISNPQQPLRVQDDTGRDILAALRETDEEIWYSNPLGRDPDNAASVRDGIELAFSRPAGTGPVKLLLNVQNTWWVSHLATQVLSLPGHSLEAWYDELNTSAEARSVLFDAIIREGALSVEVWNGTVWQYKGFVWEVGPSLPKDLVVLLDLSDIEGEELKVRLESTAGLWMINSVVADYTVDDSMDIRELFPDRAITQTGVDIRDILQREDGDYYVMPTTEDRAELVFTEPERDPTRERTFVLSTSGYYKIHLSPEGDPQFDVLARLLKEPGVIGAFSISKMNELVKSAMAELRQ